MHDNYDDHIRKSAANVFSSFNFYNFIFTSLCIPCIINKGNRSLFKCKVRRDGLVLAADIPHSIRPCRTWLRQVKIFVKMKWIPSVYVQQTGRRLIFSLFCVILLAECFVFSFLQKVLWGAGLPLHGQARRQVCCGHWGQFRNWARCCWRVG